LGVFEKNGVSTAKKQNQQKEGIGGAEIDCNSGGISRCSGMLASSLAPTSDLLALADQGSGSHEDLVAVLDRYIEQLKVIPFGIPAVGDVSSPFGVRVSPFSHSLRMHEGVDFSLSRGSSIYSSAFGKVVNVERSSTYGLFIDVEHNGRLVTRYAHLSRALVTPGQPVSRGQVIGLAGSSGRSTGPHLHFEVLVDGKQRNPSRFLALAQELKRIA
jgi:murein DD-endopeptidase MepM/ murein hydrolase activator NlpD